MEHEGRAVPIVRSNPNNIAPVFVNDFIVTFTETEYYLTFSLVEPPSVASKEELEKVTVAEAAAVTRLVITPQFAEAVARVLSEVIERRKSMPSPKP